jgi:tRNA dimethylallyltransferase
VKTTKPDVVVIAGPTASGKTAFSVELAKALHGEIVNADSMQIYREMHIGTAKPTEEEKKGIPHHLLDIVNPNEEFNTAIYRHLALPVIEDIRQRKNVCFVVGGTGLYIKTLLGGIIPSPPSNPILKEKLKQEWETDGGGKLYARLKDLDPESAEKIHPNDQFRIIRALELFQLTKRKASETRKSHRFGQKTLNALKFCLKWDREELYDRINERTVMMFKNGLIEETEKLLKMGYSPELKSMGAIGYRHAVKYIQGTWSYDIALENMKKDTRRYAKRQITWFKADPEVRWIHPEEAPDAVELIKALLRKTA